MVHSNQIDLKTMRVMMVPVLFLMFVYFEDILVEDNMSKFETLYELESIYDLMKPAQEKSKEAFAWFSGIDHPLFNAIMHLKTDTNIEEKVDALLAHAPEGVPLSFWVHNQNGSSILKDALEKRGFQSMMVCPLMERSVTPMELPGYEIGKADLAVFYDILSSTFHLNEDVAKGFAEIMKNIECEHYLIHLEGQPVGIGTLIPNGKVGLVCNVATLSEYQKRGCGRAMMEFLTNRASELGLEKLILQSSPEAEKLYDDLEFTKCFDVEIYARYVYVL